MLHNNLRSDRNFKHPTSRQNFGDGPGQTPKLILTLCHNKDTLTPHSKYFGIISPHVVVEMTPPPSSREQRQPKRLG